MIGDIETRCEAHGHALVWCVECIQIAGVVEQAKLAQAEAALAEARTDLYVSIARVNESLIERDAARAEVERLRAATIAEIASWHCPWCGVTPFMSARDAQRIVGQLWASGQAALAPQEGRDE